MGDRNIARRGLMLVLSSPSGAGKTTISRALLERDPNLAMSISATTRPKRPGETDGIDVVAVPVGADYPKGLLVVQDGYNVDAAGEKQNQNFKYVSWADVADALALD